jgi:hypothetical protein
MQGLRRRAQNDSDEAYAVLLDIMRNGDKDAARAAAAVKVLQLAGAAMSEDRSPDAPDAKPAPARELTAEQLETIAAQGEG